MDAGEGTTLSIDSAAVVHSGASRYTVSTIARFASRAVGHA